MSGNSEKKKYEDYFSREHLKEDLGRRSVRGGVFTAAAQVLKLVLQMGSNAVLARLLLPEDFGMVAMVTAVLNFILIFRDFGLSQATVQNKEITHRQVSNLFWINAALGTGIMVVTWLGAPLIASFYGEERLFFVTLALSFGIFFEGLGVQHGAILRRQMRFKELAFIDIGSMSLAVASSLTAAFLGAGYWSLVILQIGLSFYQVVFLWSVCRWRPGPYYRGEKIGKLLAFGGYLSGFSFINYFARNLDKVLLGKFKGSYQVGVYSRAYSLMLLPLSQILAPINGVAVSALSQLQDEPEKLKRYYLKVIKLVSYVSFVTVCFLLVFSEEVIGILLGPKWVESAILFRILSIAAFFQPLGSSVGWLLVALGLGREMFLWGIFSTSILVLSFIAAIGGGAYGMAVAFTASNIFIVTLLFIFVQIIIGIRFFEVVEAIFYPTALTLSLLAFLFLSRPFFVDGLFLPIIYAGGSSVIFVGILLSLWPNLRRDLLSTFTQLIKLLKKKE